MPTYTDEERVRCLIARAEHHERLAAQIRHIVCLLLDEPPHGAPRGRPPSGLRRREDGA